MRLCAHLRWSGFYDATWATPEELDAALRGASAPFSCNRTCQVWGPDDDLVEPDRCDVDRGCFEASSAEPRRTVA